MTSHAGTEKTCPAFARGLRHGAGIVFTALLVWAPLNFGSTRAGGSELLAGGCFLGSLLWALSCVWGQLRPQWPLLVAGAAALVVLATLPWLFDWVAPTPVAPFTQVHFAQIAARWPFSIVWRTPANSLALLLGFVAALLALIDLARSSQWGVVFSLALAGTGVVVALLALAQNFTSATGIYWRNDGRMPGNFCGTFFHHTSAGAYFNSVWPSALGLTWLAWHQPSSARFRWLSALGCLALVCLAAAHASHVSRFPQFAALLVLPVLLWRLGWRARFPWVWLMAGICLTALLIVLAGRTGDIAQRWRLLFTPAAIAQPVAVPQSQWAARMRADLFVSGGSERAGGRVESWSTALRSIAERPALGHGPANWMGAASQNTSDPFVRTFFQFVQFTHQDLLQFAVEWGLPAMIAWWTILVGAVVAGLRASSRVPLVQRQLAVAAACALAAVLLQAQLDFPLEIPAVAFNAVVLAALAWAGAITPVPAVVR